MAAKSGAPPMPPMQRTRLKLEEKVLDFEFEVVNVQFNQLGCYKLRLTVENPLLEGSGAGVQLRIGDGDVLYTSEGTTDAIEQSDLNDIYAFERKKFVFTLPQGFCKNDKNHDVRLKIEVLLLRKPSSKDGQKVGEAYFAIYPRTNQPRINLLAGKNEDLYHYGNIMALLRVRNDELAMHCGRLAYTVAFHEHRPPKARPAPSRQSTPWPNLLDHRGKEAELTDRSTVSKLEVPAQQLGPILLEHEQDQQLDEEQDQQPMVTTYRALTPEDREETPEPPKPREEVHSEPPSSEPGKSPRRRLPSDASFHLSTPGYSPEPDLDPYVTEEPPVGDGQLSMSYRGSDKHSWHVSPPGKETIRITLHGASNLPALSDGKVPQPFAIVKSSSDEKTKAPAQGITHAADQPTHSPNWEETLSLEINEENAQDEAVILSVADSRTKELLVSYRVPVSFLQPFHHYHLELVKPLQNVPSGARLFVTVVRQRSLITRQTSFTYTALEVFLQSFEMPLKNPVGTVTAVARIVPDYEAYREHLIHRTPGAGGVLPTTVTFPKPSSSSFEVPFNSTLGQPQVSPAGVPQEQPTWNCSFMFQGRDGITLFADGAALVIEYYRCASVTDRAVWHLLNPLGFSLVPLTPEMYQKLLSETGRQGIRVENLSIQDTDLRNTSNTVPSVGLFLRLIDSERPDMILMEESTCCLPPLEQKSTLYFPVLDPELMGQLEKSQDQWEENSMLNSTLDEPHILEGEENLHPLLQRDHHIIEEMRRDGISLPPHDALTMILPDSNLLYYKSPHERAEVNPDISQPTKNPRNEAGKSLLQNGDLDYLGSYPTEKFQGDVVQHHEGKELENYRSAMQRMANDIIALRKQAASLEAENSQLRSDLSLHQDLGRTLLDDTDIDVMTKAEIADRIVSLKHKLASETQEIRKLKDKIQQLQNELIRKNDREKELVLLQRAHQQQQVVLRKYQEKLGKTKLLEETIRQQEKVIEKMERILDERLKERPKGKKEAPGKKAEGSMEDSMQREVRAALMAENARLRGEVEQLRLQSAPIILQQPPMPQDTLTDSEKLSLLAKLEKSQCRVQSLESQLEEAARKWGREKQDLSTKLSEQDHGFARTSTMILHDYPLKNGSDAGRNLRRPQKLNPLN